MRRRAKIVALGEKLHTENYLSDQIKDLGFSIFVYSYETGSYDGSGFSVWKVGRKWYYSSLSHCSCNGPFDFIYQAKNAGFTFKEVKKVSTEYNYDPHAPNVISYIEKHK